MKLPLVGSLLALALLVPSAARAQSKFEFGKSDEVKDVKATEWTATAEAGVVFTTGNSRTTTLTGAVKATRKQQKNKLSLEATGTLAKASTLAVRAGVAPGAALTADDVIRVSTTSAESYTSKVRYDRFLTEFNSLFIAALAGADVIAGKDFAGGGQLGYARLLYKTEKHEVTGEIGYDLSYENYVDPAADSLAIHSARGFVGYKGKLTADTSVDGSLELLGNLNRQSDDVGPMKDLRANGVAAVTTKLSKAVSLAFSLTAKFDNVPAPFSLSGYTVDAANPPEALKLDTTTKASLIVTFL